MKDLLSLPDFQLLTIENKPANVPGKLIPFPESSQCASSPAAIGALTSSAVSRSLLSESQVSSPGSCTRYTLYRNITVCSLLHFCSKNS